VSASATEVRPHVERARRELATAAAVVVPSGAPAGAFAVNPSLRLVPVPFRGLAALVAGGAGEAPQPAAGDEILLCFVPPGSGGGPLCRAATPEDLLALKIVVEGIDPAAAAAAGGMAVGAVDALLRRAAESGVLLAPGSRIRRSEDFPRGEIDAAPFLVSGSFTLQWHLTQACDLHCGHCYDRSPRPQLGTEEGLALLEELRAFSLARGVAGAVSFSGGNPLLHPGFPALWRRAHALGLTASILGNPAPREQVEEIVAAGMPWLYQVSLEGLEEQNDRVRGAGHFARTMAFLGTLRELGVPTIVMLTLTEDNVDDVIPLARRLEGLVDRFHWNRLAMVGEGARLRLPDRSRLRAFLEAYLDERERLPLLGLKENLLNVPLREREEPPFGGCTGFGCGAAFSFLAVLPDGEAHACRKFPSPVGNVAREGIAAVYDGETAARYRAGCGACAACPVRPVCGGCLAVVHGLGLDPLRERDPLCPMEP